MARNYNLGFISDDKIFEQVRSALLPYDCADYENASAASTKHNPLFRSWGETATYPGFEGLDCLDMVASTLSRRICRFHSKLVCVTDKNWTSSHLGFDLQNISESIFVDMVDSCADLSAPEARRKFMRMHTLTRENTRSMCYVVDFSAPRNTDEPWNIAQGKKPLSFDRIRRVSLLKFYELVFGNSLVYKNLRTTLPRIIDDVLTRYFSVG